MCVAHVTIPLNQNILAFRTDVESLTSVRPRRCTDGTFPFSCMTVRSPNYKLKQNG